MSIERYITGGCGTWIAPFLALLLVGGCSEQRKPAEIVSLEGKIESVKVNAEKGTGEIIVQYHSERHGQVTGKAVITKDTEIMINGVAADVTQLQAGERIRGDVLIERQGDDRKYTAKKIFIDRPTAQSAPAAEQPAPATGG